MKTVTIVVEPAIGPDGKILYYDVDLHEDNRYVCGVASFWIYGRTIEEACRDAQALADLLQKKEA
jgi:hypothetical protein